MVRVKFIILMAVLLDCVALGKTLTVVCEEPRGPRVDYGALDPLTPFTKEYTLELGEDRATGVNPVFVIDLTDRKSMTVIWGDTKTLPEAIARPPQAKVFPIVHYSDDQISAINSYSGGVWVFSLFHKLGFGIFTRQSHYTFDGNAHGEVFYSKCQFSVAGIK